jgi:hypothetical protein
VIPAAFHYSKVVQNDERSHILSSLDVKLKILLGVSCNILDKTVQGQYRMTNAVHGHHELCRRQDKPVAP